MADPQSQFPAKVRSSRCSTCIFGPNSPITRETFAELASGWAKMRGGHQICHQHGIEGSGEDVWCAGFWQTQVEEHFRRLFVALGYVVLLQGADPE